jgi:hypothetical protein
MLTFDRVWGDVRLAPVGYANDLMVVVWIRLPMARYANDLGVVGFVGVASALPNRCLDSIESWI